jgi:hypothetical protein
MLCRVHVGEIIAEGSERNFLQTTPAPYNIVLEDGTYKGVVKLGIKFISNVIKLGFPYPIITFELICRFLQKQVVIVRDNLLEVFRVCNLKPTELISYR